MEKEIRRKKTGLVMKIRFLCLLLYMSLPMVARFIWGDMSAAFVAGGTEILLAGAAVTVYAFETAVGYMMRRRLHRDQIKNARQTFQTVLPLSALTGAAFGVICFLLSEKLSILMYHTEHGGLCFMAVAPALIFLGGFGTLRGYLTEMGYEKPAAIISIAGAATSVVMAVVLGILAGRFGEKVQALMHSGDIAAAWSAIGVCCGISVGTLVSFAGLLILNARKNRDMKEMAERGMSLVIDRRYDVITSLRTGIFCWLFIPAIMIFDHIFFTVKTFEGQTTEDFLTSFGILAGECIFPVAALIMLICGPFCDVWKGVIAAVSKRDIAGARGKLSSYIHMQFMCIIPAVIWLELSSGLLVKSFAPADSTKLLNLLIAVIPVMIPAAVCIFNTYFLFSIYKRLMVLIDIILAVIAHVLMMILIPGKGVDMSMTVIGSWYGFFLCLALISGFEITIMLSFRINWWKSILTTVIASVISALPAVAVNAMMENIIGGLLTLALSLILSLAVYLVALVVLGGLTRYELERLPFGEYLLPLADRFDRDR